jgi:hypothetical protein
MEQLLGTSVSQRAFHRNAFALFCIWIVIGLIYFSLAGQWISISMRDKKLVEYLEHTVQAAASESRPHKEIRSLVLYKAEQLSLHLSADQIRIFGTGDTLRVIVNYGEDIKVPVLDEQAYRLAFNHEFQYKLPR